MRLLFTFIALLTFTKSYCQSVADNWYFGVNAGLNFTSGVPVILNDGQIHTNEGVASMSNSSGQLLFYTDGVKIWNRNHVVMPNGRGLNGDYTTTQSAIIVTMPDDSLRYYVFTADAMAGFNGLCYSIVNMRLNAGLGDVETKNIQLLGQVCEKIVAVRHCNGKDIWVITHDWNSNVFYSFLVTGRGIRLPAIASGVGRVIAGNSDYTIGCMKVSPDSRHLALAHSELAVDLLDFDNSTGAVSNPVDLLVPGIAYGIEFSPNSSVLYVSNYYHDYATKTDTNFVLQYQINLPTNIQIVNSKRYIFKDTEDSIGVYGSLQIAPDGKIYLAEFNKFALSFINYPDSIGDACGFQKDALQLANGQRCTLGLPNYIQGGWWQRSYSFSSACESQQIQFTSTKSNNNTTIKWDFDDPSSGVNNFSALPNPSHYYGKPGLYTVKLIHYSVCGNDTISKIVQAGPMNFTLGADTTLCNTTAYLLSPSLGDDYTYLWQDGSTGTALKAAQSDLYWVEVTNKETGCKQRDSIQVRLQPGPQFTLGADLSKCEGDLVTLSANVSGASYAWNTGNQSNTQSVSQPGIYWLEVGLNRCINRDSIKIDFYPHPVVGLGNDTTLCNNDVLLLNAQNTGARFIWQDGSTNQQFTVRTQGQYAVTVSKDGCGTSDTIKVEYKTKPAFNLGSDKTICEGQTVMLSPLLQNNTVATYLWQDGSQRTSYAATQPGLYILKLSNFCGVMMDSINIFKGVCKLYVPSAFTPNGDGRNDIFKASFGENISSYMLQVYNRWGQKVFESHDMIKGWDGKYLGALQPPGTYIWMIQYKSLDKKTEILKGSVTLIN